MSRKKASQSNALEASGIPVHCSHDEIVDVVSLVPHPRNPNKHPDDQIALLARIIRAKGWRSPIVVSRRSGFIVAGHGRLAAAGVLQVEKVPVDYQDFATDADEISHLVADNRIAELAEMGDADLAALLSELKGMGGDIGFAGFTDEAMADLQSAIDGLSDANVEGESETKTHECPKCGHHFMS